MEVRIYTCYYVGRGGGGFQAGFSNVIYVEREPGGGGGGGGGVATPYSTYIRILLWRTYIVYLRASGELPCTP